MKRGNGFKVSERQRVKVMERACIVCSHPGPCDPAHVIPKGMASDDGDPRAVVPLCRTCHRAYDTGSLDILPSLEPHWRSELAFAVERVGLVATLRRVTNERLAA